MRAFYTSYLEGDYPTILTRFGFVSNNQTNLMYNYLESMVDNFLLQGVVGSNKENVNLGTLMSKSLASSYSRLEETIALETSTRYLANYNLENNKTC